MTDDFFRDRIEQMNDLRHALAVLASRMPWAGLERRLVPLFAPGLEGSSRVATPGFEFCKCEDFP